MRGAAAKTHRKRIGRNCEHRGKFVRIDEKTTSKQRSQQRRSSDAKFQRFSSIFGVRGAAIFSRNRKTAMPKCMRFFLHAHNSQTNCEKGVAPVPDGRMRGAVGGLGGCKSLAKVCMQRSDCSSLCRGLHAGVYAEFMLCIWHAGRAGRI